MVKNYQRHLALSCLLFLCIIPFHFLQAQTRNQLSLSPSILEGYKAKGYIEFVDDNPYLSGTGLPSNDINGKIQVLNATLKRSNGVSNTSEEHQTGINSKSKFKNFTANDLAGALFIV